MRQASRYATISKVLFFFKQQSPVRVFNPFIEFITKPHTLCMRFVYIFIFRRTRQLYAAAGSILPAAEPVCPPYGSLMPFFTEQSLRRRFPSFYKASLRRRFPSFYKASLRRRFLPAFISRIQLC
ncbi:MAG: hypothetical protein IJO54_02125 [Oscillospiraceae bacterium]|nr:hypothetical protein [Oscillospiraceae bacterium]